MAWVSFTFASTITPNRLAAGAGAREMLSKEGEPLHFVHTSSRRGALLRMTERIAAAVGVSDLYLLRNEAVLSGDALDEQLRGLEALLAMIKRDPQRVADALRERHQATTTVSASGFEPLTMQIVYGDDAVIEDGWYYPWPAHAVRESAAASIVGTDPQPAGDDDGESLAYAIGFLRSHAALLHIAVQEGLAVAYAEMNPA